MPDATSVELKRGFHYINVFFGTGVKKKLCQVVSRSCVK